MDWSWAEARESWRSALISVIGEKSVQDISMFQLPGRSSAYDVKLVSAYEVMEDMLSCNLRFLAVTFSQHL